MGMLEMSEKIYLTNKEKVVMMCHNGDIPEALLNKIVDTYWKG